MATQAPRSLSKLLAAIALAALAACTCPTVTMESGDLSVGALTDPNPAELGDNSFRFWVERKGEELDGARVRLRMFMPGMPMNSDDTWIDATPQGDGEYTAVGDFSMGGSWQVEVGVTPQGGDEAVLTFPYDIEWKLK